MKIKRGKAVAGLVAGLTVEDATVFNEILNRIKQAANVSSDNAIARLLGLRQSSISTAKTRGSIPPSWIINASNLFNVSADWLIYGDERNPPKQTSVPRAPAITQHEPEINKSYDSDKLNAEMALDLSGDEFEGLWLEFWREKKARRGWLQIEVIKRFPEFLEWLNQRPHRLVSPLYAALNKGDPAFYLTESDDMEDD